MTETVYKAAVIGSGAGGAPAAAILAEQWGDRVVLLEAGEAWTAADFNQIEKDMVPRLYAQGGAQATEDGSVTVLQGHCLGGSTVINDALCFRPPPEIVERWKAYGVEIDTIALNAAANEVDQALGVVEIPKSQINKANYLVGLGAARLGWSGERLRHNAAACVQCGFRHIGCAYDAKRSMQLTFIPRAVAAGAHLHTGFRVTHLERSGSNWLIHPASDSGNSPIRAEHLILAAGVVQTPTLLLRSGINPHGAAGTNLQFHLQSVAWGDFPDRVDGFAGIPMAYGILEFADIYNHRGPGFLMEAVNVQPMAFATQPQSEGPLHEAILSRYAHLAGVLSLVRSSARGRIQLHSSGRPMIDYPLVAHDADRQRQFYQNATELFLAAGASRVLLAHRQQRWVTAPPPDSLPLAPGLFYHYTAHPFGGATRGSVCDPEGRVQGQTNLSILDASAFPEALGVNPQITIAALSILGARRILAEA